MKINMRIRVRRFQFVNFHVCDVPMTKTYVDQSELVNAGVQIE